MMKKKQSIIALVLAAIVTVLLGWTMIKGWGPTGTGSMKNINLGLDLSGGVSITYQAVKDNPTDEEMSDTRYKLEQRAQQYSEEAQVYLQGDNRITIEIPGATDATTILEEMGKPGSLYFIKQTNDDGTENYTYDSSTGEYVLNGKTIEELEEDGKSLFSAPLRGAKASHRRGLLEIALWMPGGEIIELLVCQLHQHKITHASLCLRVNQAHHASIARTRRMAAEQMRCAHRSHYCRHDGPKNNGPKMMNVRLAVNQTQCYILYLALEATPP